LFICISFDIYINYLIISLLLLLLLFILYSYVFKYIYKRRIKVYPNGNEQDAKDGYLTIGLRNESITNDDQFAYANFVVAVRNTNDYSCYKTRGILNIYISLFHF